MFDPIQSFLNPEPSDNLDQVLEERLAEEGRASLYAFLLQCWPYISPHEYIDNWHVRDICRVLEAVHRGEIKRIVINIPPGHAKSHIVTVCFTVWKWIHNPRWSCLTGSYEHGLSIRDSQYARNIITSDWFQRRYVKGAWQLRSDINRSDDFANTLGGRRMATSVGGRGTGYRVDCVIVDDPLKADDFMSEAKRETARRWFFDGLSSRLADPRNGQIIIIMQRLHNDDLTGHILRAPKLKFEHMRIPTEFEPRFRSEVYATKETVDPYGFKVKFREKIWEDPRTEAEEPLFPELFTPEVIEEEKAKGAARWAGQHQQRPSPEEGGRFKKAYWRFWKEDGVANDEQCPRPHGCYEGPAKTLPKLEQVAISVDASFKDGALNDYCVILVIGIHKADRYVLHVKRAKMTMPELTRQIRAVLTLYPNAARKIIEDKANGIAVIQTLQSEINGIIPIEPLGGKEARASAVEHIVESGNVYLKDGAHWVDEFIQELADFPNGSYDDSVDALTQALNYFNVTMGMSRAIAMATM